MCVQHASIAISSAVEHVDILIVLLRVESGFANKCRSYQSRYLHSIPDPKPRAQSLLKLPAFGL